MSHPYREIPLLTNHSLAPWTAPKAPLWRRMWLWLDYVWWRNSLPFRGYKNPIIAKWNSRRKPLGVPMIGVPSPGAHIEYRPVELKCSRCKASYGAWLMAPTYAYGNDRIAWLSQCHQCIGTDKDLGTITFNGQYVRLSSPY